MTIYYVCKKWGILLGIVFPRKVLRVRDNFAPKPQANVVTSGLGETEPNNRRLAITNFKLILLVFFLQIGT